MVTRTLSVPRAGLGDLRAGGAWTRRQSLKNALLRVLIACALGVADRLPETWLVRLGRDIGRAAHALLPEQRDRARRRIRAALPEADARALTRQCFASAGESLAVTLLLRRPRTRALDFVRVGADARAALESALAAGRGAVVVAAHLGPFELIPAAVSELGLRPAVVVRESYDPALDPVVDAHRVARGISVIHRGAPNAGVQVVRALRDGRPVGILPDLGGRVAACDALFLGASVPFPVGPARLAARLGAPLLALTLERRTGGETYELRANALEGQGTVVEVTQRVAGALQAAIFACPTEWLWMARVPPAGRSRRHENAGLQKNPGTR